MFNYRIYFIEKVIYKTLEDLKFCKTFIKFEYEPDNNFEVKINELIDKLEDFLCMLEEADR